MNAELFSHKFFMKLRFITMIILLTCASACGGADENPSSATKDSGLAIEASPVVSGSHDNITTATATSAGWPRPRSAERRAERDRLVDRHLSAGFEPIRHERTLAAMRAVPRHWFVPDDWQRFAYDDSPLPIGLDQTISQPYVVAFMTAALDIQPDDKILEVGTGSGYQAAVLSEFTPRVFTIEILEPLGRQAAATLKQRGYTTVQVRIGDGYKGWPEEAPFNAIMVTAGADHVPQPLLDQLAPGGRLILPMGEVNGVQELVLIKKDAKGEMTRQSLLPVRFVPLTGEEMEKRRVK